MRILIDTNVLSEAYRPAPSLRVLQRLDELDEDRTFISIISIAEIQRGICRLDAGRKRAALTDWLQADLPRRFQSRILNRRSGDCPGVGRRHGRRKTAR